MANPVALLMYNEAYEHQLECELSTNFRRRVKDVVIPDGGESTEVQLRNCWGRGFWFCAFWFGISVA